jgi:protocatechuate 3,4-dioxygenase beta subunit
MHSLRYVLLAMAIAVGASSCGRSQNPTVATQPTATPAASAAARSCGAPTPAQTEGPYYKAGPPPRTSLVAADTPGTKLSLSGVVRDTSCAPVPGVRVDFWQADAKGSYDNQGYGFRGYQLTDARGRYHLETVVPGEYPGRTVHIHVKVTPPGGATLTTQLYMPGYAANDRDSIYTPATVMTVRDVAAGKQATFDFVVAR